MQYLSTRHTTEPVTIGAALELGLAPDGGLYVPECFPGVDVDELGKAGGIAQLGARLLDPFFAGDPLQEQLTDICNEAFSFPIPLTDLTRLPSGTVDGQVLELFHGPSCAFKDVGARFLAACMSRNRSVTHRTVLVATSGDTGGAVAAAFHGRENVRVGILFPESGVSGRQRHQLTAWGGNVRSFAVKGSFDDCQRLLKEALGDEEWRRRESLTTANSVNIARLLPQTVYYAYASLSYHRRLGVRAGFIVPTGNVGNVVAALWARRMGFPVGEIVMATNANRTLVDFFATGKYQPRPVVSTLANAMDVGDPSNMERVFHLYPDREQLRREVRAVTVSDEEIRQVLREGRQRYDRVFDPHTATAIHVGQGLDSPHWIVVATAHPAKFEEIVEPLIGQGVELPPTLSEILSRPSQGVELEPIPGALRRQME